MNVLVGSRAARLWFPDFREPHDFDYITDGVTARGPCEYHDANANEGLRYVYDHAFERSVAYPIHLYMIKVSHCFWDHHWDKTMTDIHFFQRKRLPVMPGLLKALYDGWVHLHGAKKAKLNMSNEEFFTDAVKRQYPHDDLHKAVAYYDGVPLYERCKRDLSRAMLDESLFRGLTRVDQLRLCREEIYVTALERFLIPSDFTASKRAAYHKACRLLLTSMSKGWFPLFIALNWLELYKPDDHDFVGRFHDYFGHPRP